MSKKRTEKSKYQSPSTGEYCTPAQYITEILVTRKNKDKNLPHKFWNIQPYKKQFSQTIFWVNKLLKKHDHRAVIAALNSKEGNWIYTAGGERLLSLIHKEELKLKRISEQEVIEKPKSSKPMKQFGKKSLINRLDF